MHQNRGSRLADMAACIAAACCATAAAGSQVIRPDHLRERGTVLRRPLFPPAFRGHWSVDPRNCDRPATDDTQLRVGARSLDLYGTRATPTRMTIENAGHVVATLRSEGEGMVFVARKRLTLSPRRDMLTIRDEDDTAATTFRRCSAHRPRPWPRPWPRP